jgi:two-component system CheB/CheR fusion protein
LTTSDTDRHFDQLLEYLKQNRGFDFSGYKRASLMRRIDKRMQLVGCANCSDYIDYLEVHPSEFDHLFNAILINVTSFFRDAAPWEFLQAEIIPTIVVGKETEEPIRVWCAGAASGEEAYTIAMVLAEVVGAEAYRDRVKIYASDVDDEALALARSANYSERQVANIPQSLLTEYFDKKDDRYIFRKEYRRNVIFGRHDLVQDAPISRVDLLTCRNTLMYFNTETQSRILTRFHYALNPGGFLLMGKAEMLYSHGTLFQPLDLRSRVFVKRASIPARERLMLLSSRNGSEEGDGARVTRRSRFRDVAFDKSPTPQMVVNQGNCIILANERARSMFNLSFQDLQRPLQDLDFSYRLMELRTAIEQCYTERRSIDLKEVEWVSPAGEMRLLQIQVMPLFEITDVLLGVSIAFADVTRFRSLQDEVEHSNQELETAHEELQSANEELETTNEELQSTVEELETTNEELQSANEELETMNEELHSTNEEMQTVNDELQRRTDEVNHANTFLDAILTSMRSGVIVVDSDLQVQVWSRHAEELWGLRSDEVHGKNLMNLDIGLPVEPLRNLIRQALADASTHSEITLDAINRRGRAIRCKVSVTTMRRTENESHGVVLSMEELENGT